MTIKMMIVEALDLEDGSSTYVVEVNEHNEADVLVRQLARTPFQFSAGSTSDEHREVMRTTLAPYLAVETVALVEPVVISSMIGEEL